MTKKVCPRCYKEKWYYEFHLSGGTICATCFAETNPDSDKLLSNHKKGGMK